MDAIASSSPRAPDAPAVTATNLPPLKRREKLLYATGDLVEGGIVVSINTFLLYYLTAVCGLSGSLAGLALSITLLVDAFFDPLVGYISDNTRAKLGRRHPYMFGAIVPLAVAFAMLFSVPESLKGPVLFAYIVSVLLVERLAHSSFLLPYAALSAEMSRDYRERSSIGAYRYFFNICANLTIVTIGYGVFMKGEAGLLDRAAYMSFAWTVAGLVLVSGLVCAVGSLGLRSRMHVVPDHARASLASFVREIGEVGRNRSFRVLFLTVLIIFAAQGTAGVLGLHAGRYFWNLPVPVIQIQAYSAIVGLLLGIPLTAYLLQHFEKKQVCVAGVATLCALQAGPPLLRMAGLLPEDGQGLYNILYGINVIVGWTVSSSTITFGAMMSDSADEHELLFGVRREALYFAGLIFSVKAAAAFGSLIGGVGLDLIGFPSDIANHPNLVLPAETVRDLGLLSGPGAAIITATAVAVLIGYTLDAKRHAAIQAELAARHAAAAQGPSA